MRCQERMKEKFSSAVFFGSRGLGFFHIAIYEISKLTAGKEVSLLTAPIFLSGMILTFCTCPVVSKIWRRISSVTLGSNPPT